MNAQKLYQKLEMMPFLNKELTSATHGIKRGEKKPWESYEPTRFLYGFIMFNSLYNIDFEESINSGSIVLFNNTGKNKGEIGRIKKYVEFCTQDKEFTKEYFIEFQSLVLDINNDDPCSEKNIKIETIIEAIKNAVPDTGNRINVDKDGIDSFYGNLKNLLQSSYISKDHLEKICQYIYNVRCNIFHGVKDMRMLNDKCQRERIDIYTRILLAVNNMVFEYIRYLAEKSNDYGYEKEEI